MRNDRLFKVLEERLEGLNKEVSIVMGIPMPYSSSINERGLTQILTGM